MNKDEGESTNWTTGSLRYAAEVRSTESDGVDLSAKTMAAVLWTAYGAPEVLQVAHIAVPMPSERQILVKVAVSNIFPGDCELRRFDVAFPFSIFVRLFVGLIRPRRGARLGQEYAGEVISVGKAITRFQRGDRIFGAMEPTVPGSYAEYVVTSGAAATKLPENLTFEQGAAAVVGGLNALHFLRVAGIEEGGPRRTLLIVGAGGSIGTMAIQIAKAFGADVTVVDSADKLDALRRLGADRTVDFAREDFAEQGNTYDVVIDIVGRNVAGKHSIMRLLKVVRPGGRLVLGNPPFRHLLAIAWAGLVTGKKVRFPLAGYPQSELERLRALLVAGRVKPVIDRQYSLLDVIAAHRYVETGRRIGNVVLQLATVGSSSGTSDGRDKP